MMLRSTSNSEQQITLQNLDRVAFAIVKQKLTKYILELSSQEQSAKKRIANDIEEGKEEEFDFDVDQGCTFRCKLPTRFGLP